MKGKFDTVGLPHLQCCELNGVSLVCITLV